MRRERDLGYCLVTEDGGGYWQLERGEFHRVRTAWLKGCLAVDTVEFHGAKRTIKLRRVDSITDFSPEAVQSTLAAARADEQDDSLNTR